VVRQADRETGQAKVKSRRARKREVRKKQELTGQMLLSLTNKTNWQQTNRTQV
jgi:hypothetical protein